MSQTNRQPLPSPEDHRPSVGQTLPHDSAAGHVTGSAAYIADLPRRCDELVVGFVPSPIASGRLRGIDLTAARAVPGIVTLITAEDLPGARRFGAIFQDEPILAEDEVLYVGQPVVVLAGETAEAVAAARAVVRLEIDAEEPILTIERAIAEGRFLGPPRRIARGDARAAIAAAPHRLAGVFHCLGQEHLYLEPQAALAVPGEEGQIVVHSSTQGPTEVQHVVAEALGLGMHQVVCRCTRMGGGFGGKETQAALPAVMAALVAHRTGRAARLVYGREDDMASTGKRHAYRAAWQVGFDDDGHILGYAVDLHSAGGAAADLSTSIMDRSMLHLDNAYWFEHVEISGQVCFTNHPPATAFRGFGGPQGMAITESVLQEVASYLRGTGRPVRCLDVQRRNLYGTTDRNITPYGQRVSRNHLPEIVAALVASSDFDRRHEAIEAANASDPLVLRGLALMPVKFGISFTTAFLNQGNALVNVYTDGTVQVSTGGTEMGQGLTTKIRQLVADAFGLPPEWVIVMPTSTEKNCNTSPTAASDLPRVFHCGFFPNDDNAENVARSKAVGEPPLMHAIGVWSAVKHALSCVSPQAARRLCLPATGEEILRALSATAGPRPDGSGWGHSAALRHWSQAD